MIPPPASTTSTPSSASNLRFEAGGGAGRSWKGFSIRTRITGLATILVCAIVAGIAATLIWVQQRQLREDFSARIDAMMSGVERIAGESLMSGDEIMLLSYLKHLMKEYPEFELALVSRAGHTSVMGAVRTELYYRTITATESEAAAYRTAVTGKQLAVSGNGKTAVTGYRLPVTGYRNSSIPPGMLVVQMGLSKTALESQIHLAAVSMMVKVLVVAGLGLLLGLFGSWLLSRRLAGPIVELAGRIQSVAEGKQLGEVEVPGDEIAYLKAQYENMASKLSEFIRLKDELLMTLTHELNNPLAGLKALIALVADPVSRPGPREVNDTYKIMSDAVNAMELSLSNALEMFKMGHKPVLKPQEVRVNEIFHQVFRLFRPVAQSAKITLLEPLIPAAVYLHADEELLRRIVVNLVSNACKYTPPGGRVGLSLEDFADHVHISVSDTGPGVAPEDRELIFTRFYRVPGADGKARRIPGTGLGLAITKQAVDLHNGRIWVESEKGKGSVFHVTLPKNRDQKSEVGSQKVV